MNFNITKWVPIILKGMNIIEKVSNAAGKDKLNAVIDNISDELIIIEDIAGKDLLNDDDVKLAVSNVVSAIKSLENLVKLKKTK